MSERPFTIRVKIRDYEVELTGSHSDVLQSLEELPKILGRVNEAFNISQSSKEMLLSQQAEPVKETYPPISAQPGMSCPDAIVTVLSTTWGHEKPRPLGEIMDAMKVNALHFPLGTVKGRLTDLTKRGILRRIKGEKGYGYVITK